MSHVEAWLRAWIAQRTPAIKLLAFAVLAGLVWALPPMIAVALAVTMGVWLAQRERWFWAGVASAVGIGLWLPAAGGALAIGLTALLVRESRWRATRDTLLGGLLVGGLIAGWMATAGTLDAFFRQSILAGLNVASNGDGGRWQQRQGSGWS